ncbi:MAG: hypothetical protein ABIA74_06200 [bacterium]
MKKYLLAILILFFVDFLNSYNLDLPVENTTWREFLFEKSREKKKPTFLQVGIDASASVSHTRSIETEKVFISLQQNLDKFYFRLFLPFSQSSYFEYGNLLSKHFVSNDIGVICGYKFLKNKSTDFSFNLGFTIPTSSGFTPKGDIGLGIDFSKKCWKNRLRFDVIANYRYLFGYKASLDFNANGRSLVDCLFNFNFKIKKAIFDIGWDFLWREKERLSLRSDAMSSQWLGRDWSVSDENDATKNEPTTEFKLDPRMFETPSFTINTVYFGLGTIIKKTMLGIGISHQTVNFYCEYRLFAVWAKIGFVF